MRGGTVEVVAIEQTEENGDGRDLPTMVQPGLHDATTTPTRILPAATIERGSARTGTPAAETIVNGIGIEVTDGAETRTLIARPVETEGTVSEVREAIFLMNDRDGGNVKDETTEIENAKHPPLRGRRNPLLI
jgi:hypothetical protein